MRTPLVSKLVSKLVSALSAAVLAIAVFAGASQANAQNTLKVDVPFAFESGTAHFAPGVYNIHLDRGTPIIRIEGQNASAFQMTIPDLATTPSNASKLVFHRYGSQYILKEVWVAGSTSHMHTPKSKLEKELDLAQANENKQSTLALLAMGR